MEETYDQFPSMNLNECEHPIERKPFTFRYHKILVAVTDQGPGEDGHCETHDAKGKIVATLSGRTINIKTDEPLLHDLVIPEFQFSQISENVDRVMWTQSLKVFPQMFLLMCGIQDDSPNVKYSEKQPHQMSLFYQNGSLKKISLKIDEPNVRVELFGEEAEPEVDSSGFIYTTCEACGANVETPDMMAGQCLCCPKCGKELVVGLVTLTENDIPDRIVVEDDLSDVITPHIDISDILFKSDQNTRFNDGVWIGEFFKDSNRAIEIKSHPDFQNNYLVSIYNLDGEHPVWRDNVQMAPKRMRVIESSEKNITLRGHGLDDMGFPFSDYGIEIQLGDGRINSISLLMHDRNVKIDYLNNQHLPQRVPNEVTKTRPVSDISINEIMDHINFNAGTNISIKKNAVSELIDNNGCIRGILEGTSPDELYDFLHYIAKTRGRDFDEVTIRHGQANPTTFTCYAEFDAQDIPLSADATNLKPEDKPSPVKKQSAQEESSPDLSSKDSTPKTSGLAIASFICALLSGIDILIIPTLICGHMALGKIKNYPDQYKGKGFAITALIIGYLGIILGVIVGIMRANLNAQLESMGY